MDSMWLVALLPECWGEYRSAVESADPDAEELGAFAAALRQPVAVGGVATIPVRGLILQRSSLWGTSTEEISRNIRAALADPAVGSIVLDVDSPGGGVNGVPELAALIRAGRTVKPIVAVANSTAASAAYWIASAASEVVVSPSGQVGSIGVYLIHQDQSQYLENEGVRTTIISAGKYKIEGNPWQPLSDEARAAFQERVDELYAQFTTDVAAGRGTTPEAVRAGYGEGRVRGAERAINEGLADRVGTLEETVARLAGGPAAPIGNRAAEAGAEAGVTDAGSGRVVVELERLKLNLSEL